MMGLLLKRKNILTFCAISLFLVLLNSCNFPSPHAAQPTGSTQLPVFETAQAAVNATLTQQALLLPSFTASPILTNTPLLPTITQVPPTSSIPMVSVSKQTNCRLGTDISFELLGSLLPGVMAEVVAMDTSKQYYYIRNPQDSKSFCWLWGYYATVVGDITSLPLFTPMPTPKPTITPTPVPNFSITYTKLHSCSGEWFIEVKVKNTGSAIWSSGSIIAKDNFTSTTTTERKSDKFEDWNGCLTSSVIQADLAPGESGSLRSDGFTYDPSFNDILVTIQLCTQNAMAGSCLTKQITFKP
jgi:hypothetical protein